MQYLNFLWLLFLVFTSPLSFGTIFYVTPAGAGVMNGTSWNNAYPGTSLQTAIDNANAGDEVWVACGTYFTTGSTDRMIAFSMKDGVGIYGGFSGTETLVTERDLACGSCSILSGEIGLAGNADNSYNVIYNQLLTNDAVLDGFVVRDGNDDRWPTSDGNGLGGGIYNHGYGVGGYCHPTVRNCIFTANQASWGAGVFNNGYNGGNALPVFYNCLFYQNHATIEAGGMDSYGVGGNASPTLYNCIFYENTSATNVGAMYAWGGNGGTANPVLINCAFINNSATNGYGGAFIADNLNEDGVNSSGTCVVTLQNCILWGNTATGEGQQFYIRGTGAQVIATYSDIDLSGQPAPHLLSGPGTGNIDADPLFLAITDANGADDCWFTADDGLLLQTGSPGVDAGTTTGVSTTDIAGAPRLQGSSVDMGAYENIPSTFGFEDQENTTLSSYPNPFGNYLIVELNEPAGEEIVLLDLQGKQIPYSIDGTMSDHRVTINTCSLEPGLYILRYGSMARIIQKE